MKKRLSFILFFVCLFVFSQDKKITIEFKNATIEECINQIEKNSEYQFYFKKEWLNKSQLINLNFNNASINEILTAIFNESKINFYLTDSKIILTLNNLIYDKVSSSFLESESNKNEKESAPVLISDEENYRNSDNENISLHTIGKESKENQRGIFEIKGKILNNKTGEPISNAVIKIKGKSNLFVSDEKGAYRIQLQYGKHIIEVESFGYKKLTIQILVYDSGTFDFNVSESVTELNEVVVEAKSDKIIKNTTSGVTSFNMEEMKNVPMVLGERDILKIATTLPGIKNTGEGSSGVNVRGGKEDQNLFLLDYATIYNPNHFFGFFSSINPYIINEADIYKGSIPAEFGGRIASVFNITSKNGNSEKISGEGGLGPVTSNLTLNLPIIKEKSSLQVAARGTYSDWILKSVDNEEIKKSKASFYDLFLKYSHKISEKTSFDVFTYYSKDKFKLTLDSTYSYSNRILGIKARHYFKEDHSAQIGITNSEYKFDIGYDGNNQNSFDFNFKVNETKLFYKGSLNFRKKHKISYGLNSVLYNINPGTFSPTDTNTILEYKSVDKEKGLESALFASDIFNITPKLTLNLGLRYSNFLALGSGKQRVYQNNSPTTNEYLIEEVSYGNNQVMKAYNGLEYRIALRQMITETFSTKLSYDTNYQYIHKLSTNTTQSPTDTWKISDLNIKPTYGQQISLGLFKNFKNIPYEISLESYYKKSSNFMDFKTGAQLILNDHIETEVLQGEGKAYGIELLVKKTSGRLNGWAGYTYSRTLVKLDSPFDGETVNNGKYFPANFDKPHDFNLILNYKFTKRYSASTNFVYQTGRPITYPVGSYDYGGSQYTLYSNRNEFRIPDYYRLDIGFNIEGNHKIKKLAHSFWNISIYNVLGRNNPYSIYFVTEDGKIKGYKTSIFSIPVPTISYNFKF